MRRLRNAAFFTRVTTEGKGMAVLRDYEAHHVKMFLEENWSEFVSKLEEDYDGEAEEIAEEIVNKLK